MRPNEKGSTQNIIDQIDEKKRKLALLDGDRKAYYESSQWTVTKNDKRIADLRKENKELHKLVFDRLAGDEHVVSKGLSDHPRERNALRAKPGHVAIEKMDEKVRDKVNILNNLRYKTVKQQKNMEELQTQLNQMVKDSSDAVATDAGDSNDAQTLRSLENRLDKARLKCQEAEHIRKTYDQIKAKLGEEHKTFENTLDQMEERITKCRQEVQELKAMNNDAQIARDAAKQDLERQERQVYEERRRRELELALVKKEADEKRQQHDRIERRIARGSIQQDDMNQGDRQIGLSGEEEQARITSYEEAFKRIKDATGVSDTQEVVQRFENQGDTQQHLEDLKKDGEKKILRLLDEKDKLQMEFEEMKYSGEAKLSSGQKLLEEFEAHLEAEETHKQESQDKLERGSRTLLSVKSGVEHLAQKLLHLKTQSSQVQKAKISPTSAEFILDQLSICEEKLLRVLEELDGKDLDELLNQMEQEEFHNIAEYKLPAYNTRITLPTSHKDNMYDDEEDSGDDEDNLQTRQSIKRQSQLLMDLRMRRKVAKRKKKITK